MLDVELMPVLWFGDCASWLCLIAILLVLRFVICADCAHLGVPVDADSVRFHAPACIEILVPSFRTKKRTA